jgi:hypothetical protein
MPLTDYKVHLWANLPGGHIPSIGFETETEREAAALALLHFRRLGHSWEGVPMAHLEVESSVPATNQYMIRDILWWLKQPEQAEFVKAQKLEVLLQ